MEKITSDHIKLALHTYFRFKRQFPFGASEVGLYSADFIALKPDKHRFIEVEVKVSKADLLADFKKPKHEYYLSQGERCTRAWEKWWIPQEFYFAVPEHMEEYARNTIEDFSYGLFVYKHHAPTLGRKKVNYYPFDHRLRLVKKAKKLHNNPIPERVYWDVLSRMSSELCRVYLSNYELKVKNELTNADT